MEHHSRLICTSAGIALVASWCGAGHGASAGARERPAVIGSEPQLFVDRHLIDRLHGAALQLHPPQRREVVFRFDAPWEGRQSGYVTVLRDGARYRMYYRGGGDLTREVTCLAESSDGIRWSRPSLGLHTFDGSRENNILLMPREKGYAEAHNFTPFLDTNPAAPAEARYKAVALAKFFDPKIGDRRKMLVGMVSSDGVRWRRIREEPILTEGSFDSQNVAFWDRTLRRYICYSRGGRDGIRSILRSTSADFLHWSRQEWIDLDRTPREHFYTNAITPYYRSPQLYLGFPMRFVPERKEVGTDRRPVDALSDAVLISSRDGVRWDRTFMEAFIRPGPDAENWGNGHGNNTPAWGMLPTGAAEISLYWAEHYGATPQLRRGVVRIDGFTSVHTGYFGGGNAHYAPAFRWPQAGSELRDLRCGQHPRGGAGRRGSGSARLRPGREQRAVRRRAGATRHLEGLGGDGGAGRSNGATPLRAEGCGPLLFPLPSLICSDLAVRSRSRTQEPGWVGG